MLSDLQAKFLPDFIHMLRYIVVASQMYNVA